MKILQNGDLDESITEKLINVLQNNPYTQIFRSLENIKSFEDIHIHIASDVKVDQRVYSMPTTDQVAAIWIEGNKENVPFERDIVVHAHSGSRHRIKHYFSCYDSLQYLLLFPKGEPGWHQEIDKCTGRTKTLHSNVMNSYIQETHTIEQPEEIIQRECQGILKKGYKRISCREYYCFKFQIKSTPQMILLTGRLFQQYAVDMYIKLETTRLDFFRAQQSRIRSELYQGLVDVVNARETRDDKIGKRIVLPGTFVGGPRDMRRRYLDAMALVQRFGKPNLFITITCNSNWKEIQDELLLGQQPQDRPDLTARVFRTKLQDLKDQLFKKQI
ncbi:hypothetical protein IC582_007671 [Cucumis melo]